MLTRARLDAVMAEIRRFEGRVLELHALAGDVHGSWVQWEARVGYTAEAGALKRASLDLSRELAKLRNPEVR